MLKKLNNVLDKFYADWGYSKGAITLCEYHSGMFKDAIKASFDLISDEALVNDMLNYVNSYRGIPIVESMNCLICNYKGE